jgi:hypothetical protein
VKKIQLTLYIDAIEKVKIKIGFKYGVQIAFPASIESNCIINIINGGCNNPPIINKIT